MRFIIRRATLRSEVLEPAVVRRKPPRIVEAAVFGCIFDEEGYVVQQLLLVRANPAARISFGEHSQVVAPCRLADPEEKAVAVMTVNQKERHLMIPDQRSNLLSVDKHDPHLPQDNPGQDLALVGVASTGYPVVFFSCLVRLPYIVKQRRGEDQKSVAVAALLPSRHFDQRITDHPCMSSDITFGVMKW